MKRAIILAGAVLLAGCGGRTMELPARAPDLYQALEASKDAPELSRRISGMGFSRISVIPDPARVSRDGPGTGYRWPGQTADQFIMFWRVFTLAPKIQADGTREYALKRSPKGVPRTLALDEPPLLASLADEGDALARSGKWRAAGRAYEKSRRQAPTLPLLHARLGDCHTALGNFAQAFASYSRAIAIGGPNPDIFSSLGEMLEKSRHSREAEDAFEKSAGLDPDNPARWVRLARAQLRHGKPAPANKSLARALALDPACAEARKLESAMGKKR